MLKYILKRCIKDRESWKTTRKENFAREREKQI